jgi:hypothetical protein
VCTTCAWLLKALVWLLSASRRKHSLPYGYANTHPASFADLLFLSVSTLFSGEGRGLHVFPGSLLLILWSQLTLLGHLPCPLRRMDTPSLQMPVQEPVFAEGLRGRSMDPHTQTPISLGLNCVLRGLGRDRGKRRPPKPDTCMAECGHWRMERLVPICGREKEKPAPPLPDTAKIK